MSNKNVSISVIVPVYNVEKYIFQFLNSIREQTFQDFEVIFVDDGSPDNCPAILDEFVKENERYIVIHQKNAGVSAARNAGLEMAQGEYVYIVDSDDWLELDALEFLYNEANRTDSDLVYGDWIMEKPDRSERRVCFPEGFQTTDKDTIRALQFAVPSDSNRINYSRPEFSSISYFGGAPWRGLVRRSIID